MIADVAQLYEELAPRLRSIVSRDVTAPPAVIEDACQFAWSRLIDHRERVCMETAPAWLATTAVREAFKLLRRRNREESLDAAVDEVGEASVHPRSTATEDLYEQRQKIAEVRRLPLRQQRLVWLQALGLSYAEMAAHEGATMRTVERQLVSARRQIRTAHMGDV